jgi:hypothetical protein
VYEQWQPVGSNVELLLVGRNEQLLAQQVQAMG